MGEQEVREFLNQLDNAMVARDVVKLDSMMEEDAILQHITGYLQAKHEWLEQVEVDYFTYREIYSENFDIKIVEDVAVVEYDWTIIGNSHWSFRNLMTLHFNGEKLKWSGRNKLWFR